MKKKFLAFILSAVLLLALVVPFQAAALSTAFPGNVNGDPWIDTTDARLVLQYIVGKQTFTDEQKVLADVNNDGAVNTMDVRLILQYIVSKISVFPDVKAQAAFDTFSDDLFRYEVSSSTLNLHFSLRYPENYGIAHQPASWGALSNVDPASLRTRFNSFNRDVLTREQQITYDIMAYNYAIDDQSADSKYDYYYEPFESGSGDHMNIIYDLAEYKLQRQQDVDDYLGLCAGLGDEMDMLIAYEQERSDVAGIRMSAVNRDGAVQDCEDFLFKTDDNVLISSFNNRIDACDFLTQSQKDSYKSQNQAVFTGTVAPAYTRLEDFLKTFPADDTKGMAGLPNGRDYYALGLAEMGCSKTPQQLIDLTDQAISGLWSDISVIYHNDPSVLYTVSIVPDSVTTPQQMVQYLFNAYAADFPALPADLTYSIQNVDSSLEDASAPAFYFPPQIDDYQDNSIYINPSQLTDDETTFFALAHESIPGHMEQFASLMAGNLPNYRKNVNYTANAEGWAKYAEYYAYKYGSGSAATNRFMMDFDLLGLLATFRMELGVCYSGWTLDQFTTYASQYSLGDPSDFYQYLMDHPLTYAPYAAGYLEFTEIRAAYPGTDMQFHTAVLNAGPMPFSIMRQALGIN